MLADGLAGTGVVRGLAGTLSNPFAPGAAGEEEGEGGMKGEVRKDWF